jgi:4-hydroxythreonine-4-phosphate dehydrogenase
VVQKAVPRIAITPGEPAGIGPDIVIALAERSWPAELVVIADPTLLAERADRLGISIETRSWSSEFPRSPSAAGMINVQVQNLVSNATPGRLDSANADYVLNCLRQAADGCQQGIFDAMVTGPVQKSVINEAGIAFTGHTEFLAEYTNAEQAVMLLTSGELRVALLTTHLSLREVPDAITGRRLQSTLRILHDGLRRYFGIDQPRIAVLGLNPHAGESGHLGLEEQQVISPALDGLRAEGMQLSGPLPADTAFTPECLETADAILAMYHDQGLPVLKHRGFGHSVNVTLGLPIIRTSVDHGTALDLAGSGRANPGSMVTALELAIDMQSRGKS